MSRRRMFGVAAVLAIAGSLLVPSAADASDPPTLVADAPSVERGRSVALVGTGLTPGATYDLAATSGALRWRGPFVTEATADESGRIALVLVVAGATPLSVTESTVRVSDDATDVSVTVPIAAPSLTGWNPYLYGDDPVCPGSAFEPLARSFPDGTWTIGGPALTAPVTVTATGGSFDVAGARLVESLPAHSTVRVTSPTDAGVQLSFAVDRAAPQLYRTSWLSYMPWVSGWQATCFRPGETVRLSGTATSFSDRSSTRADDSGEIHIRTRQRPGARPEGVRATGALSGQSTALPLIATYPTVLVAGQSLTKTRRGLLSASGTAVVVTSSCNMSVDSGNGFDYPYLDWAALPIKRRPDICQATLQRDGNLVLRTTGGRSSGRAAPPARVRTTGS